MRREWVWGWACVVAVMGRCGVDAGLELRYPTDGAMVYLPPPGHVLVVEVAAPSVGHRSVCVVLDGGWLCKQLKHEWPRSITFQWPWPLNPGSHLLYAEALDAVGEVVDASPIGTFAVLLDESAAPAELHPQTARAAQTCELVLKSRDAAEVVASFDLRYNDQPHVVAVRDNEQPARVALRFLAQHAIHDVDPHAFAQQVQQSYDQLAAQGRVPVRPRSFSVDCSQPQQLGSDTVASMRRLYAQRWRLVAAGHEGDAVIQLGDADGGGDDTCDAGLAVVEGQDKEGHRRDCIRVMKAAGMTVRGLTPAGWPLVELRSYGRVSCDAAMETLATVTAEADEAPKWLVFSSVGDAAVASVALQPWRADAVRRTYDVALVDYGEGEGGDAQRHATPGLYFRRRGMKWANFAAVWRSHLAHLNYTAVWVVDDDIQMRVDAVNRMFAVFHRHGLWLAQPGYDADSAVTHAVTRADAAIAACAVRFTNFVENGAALLSNHALRVVDHLLDTSPSGAGLDYVMPALLDQPTHRIAVLDGLSCHHPPRQV